MFLLQTINFIFSFLLFALFFSLIYVNYYWSKYWQNYKLQTNLRTTLSRLFYPYFKKIRNYKKTNSFLFYFILNLLVEYSLYFTILNISSSFIKKYPNLILLSFIIPLLILNFITFLLILFLNHFFKSLVLEISLLGKYCQFKFKFFIINFRLSLFLLRIIFFNYFVSKPPF